MNPLTPDRFEEFYTAVHEFAPFPWQKRLASRVCAGDWPRAVALPTAAGKTACIDIAVFALACRAKDAPRRIFFVVDRRIVVDQAYEHAKKLAALLRAAKPGILKDVADSLRALTGEKDARPLDVYSLRGGMYRESAWARSPLQPTVIASTVDQVGSRLLFRGYGVSDSMKPIHAGLVGNDSLILLDEAHCAKPFDQTMQSVQKYRAWGEPNPAPFRFASITATPTGGLPETEIERDTVEDREHPVLGPRIAASKPAKLLIAEKAKGKNGRAELVKELEKHARALAGEFKCVGIIVNRVATARELAQRLGPDAVLLTGRMRPLDRDRVFAERLQPLLSGAPGEPPKFVVGTQCLECGADFDFHALVTECASLDALRQRFGRLNRIAARPSAKAVIVVRGDQTETEEKESDRDPVYANALANTWKWLNAHATDGVFDFGVAAVREATNGVDLAALNAPAPDAPVLFPAHLDCWVQTHPIPAPDPDPALFLHGPKQSGQPDVQVVFRADLGDDSTEWSEIVALCPPSSSEAVSVPIGVFKKWLAGELGPDETADVQGGAPEEAEEREHEMHQRYALRWRGPDKSEPISNPNDVTPDDTYVIPCSTPGVRALGDFPTEAIADYAEEAFQRSRDKVLLRLPNLIISEEADKAEEAAAVADALDEFRASVTPDAPVWQKLAADHFADPNNRTRLEIDKHPRGGVVITGRNRLRRFDPTYLDDSEPAESFRGVAITLKTHSHGVAEFAARFARACGLDETLYTQAGLWHDLGKLDPRFQAMLRQSSPRTVVGEPLAKSAKSPRTKPERDEARQIHRYPSGARHELLSAALVATRTDDDLLLHLIATHHGSARPFAGAVEENDSAQAPFETPTLFSETFKLPTAAQQIQEWNAELPERFWCVVRKYGWWGTAYRETVFRLADHARSAAEQDQDPAPSYPITTTAGRFSKEETRPTLHELPLIGLDGSNPLAFLAALGTLRLANRSFPGSRLGWDLRGAWTAVLHLPKRMSPDELVAALVAHTDTKRRSMSFSEDLKILASRFREHQVEARDSAEADREFADALCAYADPLVTINGGPNAGKTKPTEWYFIAGQQKLLKQAREIIEATTERHLKKCLFSPWVYDDPLEGLSLRWDPQDDLRYATRFYNPSKDKQKSRRGSVLGANRLAVEALPFFPCFPQGTRLATTGFNVINRRPFFIWPIWSCGWGSDTLRSVLSVRAIAPGNEEQLRGNSDQLGIVAWYRCEKVPNSDYSNFASARAL
jgi:CRISPR-associated endonuclease/helicase Cas3